MKHWEYLKYLIRHKWYVALECIRMGLYWHAITHDISKFRPSEWIPYARYFYGTYPYSPTKESRFCKQDIEMRFNYAWLLHQKRNKHHWQFWILHNDSEPMRIIPMPPNVIKQMACDWIGASKAIRGKDANAFVWYEKVKDQTLMGSVQRKYFERLIRK